MLLTFSCKNYLSFKEYMHFSALHNHTGNLSNIAQHTTALYGKAASGKSNWVKALLFMSNMVLHSHKYEHLLAETLTPFLLNPTGFFDSSYFETELLLGQTLYRYGFEVQAAGIETEWLYVTQPKQAPQAVFTRTRQQVKWATTANSIKYQSLTQNAQPAWLLISVLGKLSFAPALAITQFFGSNLLIIAATSETDQADWEASKQLMTIPQYKRMVVNWLRKIDASVAGLALAKASGGGKADAGELKENHSPVFNRNSIRVQKTDKTGLVSETDFIVVKRFRFSNGQRKKEAVYMNVAFEEAKTVKKIITYGFLFAHALLKGATIVMDTPEQVWGTAFTRYLINCFFAASAFCAQQTVNIYHIGTTCTGHALLADK